MLNTIAGWLNESVDIICASLGGAIVYYITSSESPKLKRFCSMLSGFIIALIFAPPICKYWNIVEYDFVIAAILALGGRWAAEVVLSAVKRLTKDKLGV